MLMLATSLRKCAWRCDNAAMPDTTEPPRHPVGRLGTIAAAIACAVLLHSAAFALITPMSIGCGTGIILLLIGAALALLPFAALAIIAARDDENAPNWLYIGLACVPVVFALDIAVVVLLLSLGFGKFHI